MDYNIYTWCIWFPKPFPQLQIIVPFPPGIAFSNWGVLHQMVHGPLWPSFAKTRTWVDQQRLLWIPGFGPLEEEGGKGRHRHRQRMSRRQSTRSLVKRDIVEPMRSNPASHGLNWSWPCMVYVVNNDVEKEHLSRLRMVELHICDCLMFDSIYKYTIQYNVNQKESVYLRTYPVDFGKKIGELFPDLVTGGEREA